MKADGGTLLYVIIAVASLIISAIGKKKTISPASSKPTPQETPDTHPEPQATWQKELEDIFGKAYDEPKAETEYPYEKPQSAEVIVSEADSSQEVYREEVIAKDEAVSLEEIEKSQEYSPIISSIKVPDQEEYELEVVGTEEERFDGKKAIIYAEIINRKYF